MTQPAAGVRTPGLPEGRNAGSAPFGLQSVACGRREGEGEGDERVQIRAVGFGLHVAGRVGSGKVAQGVEGPVREVADLIVGLGMGATAGMGVGVIRPISGQGLQMVSV